MAAAATTAMILVRGEEKQIRLQMVLERTMSSAKARSKRRAGQKKDVGVSNPNKENKEMDYQNRCLDDDLDFEDSYQDLETNYSELSGAGRVLPSWSTTPGDKINGCNQNVFKEFAFKS
ncbi:hypothetical protein Tsubulata_048111 [Turnera subulata]|uniref:Uncharacterized protein n=1 Tax=Turnera subulata TaxID=218843 RepID=A0A9Q0FP93_9ROSI|nr:hypothetical protein Tsubulata_048111 [Turnera subulata]